MAAAPVRAVASRWTAAGGTRHEWRHAANAGWYVAEDGRCWRWTCEYMDRNGKIEHRGGIAQAPTHHHHHGGDAPAAGPSSLTHLARHRQRVWRSSSSRLGGFAAATETNRAVGARAFHSSTSSHQSSGDFYKTLEVGKSASQQDIKLQFYKLSKKWHPDVNDGSDESKQRFQEVSEAYATLSNEQDRRAYDRKMSSSGFGSPRASRGGMGGGMRYASDNLDRQRTATYAWDYQKRHAARQQRAAGSKRGGSSGGSNTHHYEHGAGEASKGRRSSSSSPIGPQSSLFERFAERQRRREEATAARTGVSGINGMGAGRGSVSSTQGRVDYVSQEEHEAQTASGIVRFLQVSAVFGLIFFIATAARGNTTTTTADTRRRR